MIGSARLIVGVCLGVWGCCASGCAAQATVICPQAKCPTNGTAAMAVAPVSTPESVRIAGIGEKAAGGLARASGALPPNVARSILAGNSAIAKEQWAEARAHFSTAQSLAPSAPEVELGLLRVSAGEQSLPLGYADAPGDGRIETLVGQLQALAARAPDFVDASLELGRWLLVLGKPVRAREVLRGVLGEVEGNAEAHSLLGVAALANGDVAESTRRFRAAARNEPENSGHFTNLGSALLVGGESGEAAQAFRRVLALAPETARARSDLGTALLAGGEVEPAVRELERAVKLAPDQATYRSNLAYALLRSGRIEEALEQCTSALTLDPQLGSAWINKGLVLAERNEWSEARAAFESALRLDPEDPRAKANLADLQALGH